ncbi:MAG: TrkH family potassium uptake protein [Planctomycetota bacterium]|jgi:trk system potassium uptake protein TrkH
MNPRHVLVVVGLLLRPFALLLLLPALLDFYDGEIWSALTFAVTSGAVFGLGIVISRHRVDPNTISRIEAMAVVGNSWLLAALLGSIPYMQHGFGPIDALFESMSGFTTTGATIFRGSDFATATRGLIFWRSLTQWVGGMGIIVLFVAILPALAVAGRQMFFTEAPGPEEEALTPRIRHTAAALYRIYIILTLLEVVLLSTVGGMSVFHAVCHSCTTLAAGGFSPNPQSIADYGPAAQWIITCFMFFAGASFALQYRAWKRPGVLRRDVEFRAYFWILIGAGVVMAGLLAQSGGYTLESSLRHGLFQSASILTTTGYASEDFNLWSPATLMVLAGLMFIGGCAGSAGGGPKVIRMIILAKFLSREVLIALHPRVVRVLRIGGRPIPRDTTRQLVGFLVAYFSIFAIVALITGVLENDFRIGLTGSIVTIGNIGPGFGAIGPMETFADLSVATKLLFIFNMWVGRLEVMSVLVLLHPELLGSLFGRGRG